MTLPRTTSAKEGGGRLAASEWWSGDWLANSGHLIAVFSLVRLGVVPLDQDKSS